MNQFKQPTSSFNIRKAPYTNTPEVCNLTGDNGGSDDEGEHSIDEELPRNHRIRYGLAKLIPPAVQSDYCPY